MSARSRASAPSIQVALLSLLATLASTLPYTQHEEALLALASAPVGTPLMAKFREAPPPPQEAVAEVIAQQTTAKREQCDDGRYECVPYYHCNTTDIITDGFGLLDIRFGGELTDNAKNSPTLTHSECGDFLDVCCTSPHLAKAEKLREVATYQPGCGKRNANGLDIRIEGFQNLETQFAEYPWQVAITRLDRQGSHVYVGGGSFIHRQVVLSTAHTVRGYTGLEVRLGEWDTQHTTEYYSHRNVDVTRVIRHPHYNGGNLHNDIALLILAAPMDMRPHMDTICLPPPTFSPRGDCIVTGWGKSAFKSGDYQTVLKAISLPIVDSPTCENALRRTRLGERFQLDESFMCAGGRPGEDACTGDGGSALVCPDRQGTYYQVGIVSWGIGCGQNGLPGIYTDVRRFVPWIEQEIGKAGV